MLTGIGLLPRLSDPVDRLFAIKFYQIFSALSSIAHENKKDPPDFRADLFKLCYSSGTWISRMPKSWPLSTVFSKLPQTGQKPLCSTTLKISSH